MDGIKEYIRAMTGKTERNFIFGYVKSVNTDTKMICVVDESTDLVYENIVLSGNITIIPTVDSLVVACVVDESDVDGFLVFADQTEQIIFNGGGHDGLVKVKELTAKINALERDLNNLKTIITSWAPVPQDGGASLKAATSTWSATTITETQQTDIENKTITH